MPNAQILQFKKILIIDDLDKESIFNVIGRMEILIEHFSENKIYHHLLPFLNTYYLVTKAVVKKYTSEKNFFTNTKDLERLDVYFASLYFTPLLKFIETGTAPKPWETYFKYTSNDGIPFLQLILGINAHINSDLYFSLSKLNYNYEKDFFRVNDILQEVIPESMKFLIKEHDLIGFGSIFFKDFIEKEFHLVIENWRSEAWANFKIHSDGNIRHKLNDKTEKMGEELISLINELYHLKNLSTDLNKINNLSSKILL